MSDLYVAVPVYLKAGETFRSDVVNVPSDIATLIEMIYPPEIQQETLEIAGILLHPDRYTLAVGGPWLSQQMQENSDYLKDLIPYRRMLEEHPEEFFGPAVPPTGNAER